MYGFGGTHAFWPAGTKRPHKHLAFRRFCPSERAWECRPPTVDSQEGFLVQPPRATEPTGNTDDLGTFQVAPVGQARLPPMTLHAADEGRGPHLSPGRGVCPRPLSWCAHSCQHHCSMVPSPGARPQLERRNHSYAECTCSGCQTEYQLLGGANSSHHVPGPEGGNLRARGGQGWSF